MGLSWIPANLVLYVVLTVVGYAILDRRWRQLWTQLGFTRPEGVSLAVAAVAGVVFSAPAIVFMLSIGDLPDAGASFAHEDFVGIPLGPATVLAAFAWALLHQALPEELLFRGLLLGQLARRLSDATAIMIQGGVFWVMHVPGYVYLWQATPQTMHRLMIAMVAATTLGLSFVLGWLRMRDANRSLLPPIVTHTVANGITFTAAMVAAG